MTGPRNRDSSSRLWGDDSWPWRSARHEKREKNEEDVLGRKAALWLYLRELLGRALRLQSPLWERRAAFSCFPLSHPMIFTIAIRVGGQLGQHGGAEGQKILPVLPGHQVHRCCWSGALPRTHSESESHQELNLLKCDRVPTARPRPLVSIPGLSPDPTASWVLSCVQDSFVSLLKLFLRL